MSEINSVLQERTLSVEMWKKQVSENSLIVDIRQEQQTAFGKLPGARHIPATRLQDFYQLPKDKKIYVYCQKGELSEEVLEVLLDAGYDAYQLEGGYLAYLAALDE